MARFTPGEVYGPAVVHLQQTINRKLHGQVSPRLLGEARSAGPALGLHLMPHRLLAALWLQFGQALAAERRLRRCAYCQRPFLVGVRVARRHKQYCSISCRVMQYHRNRKRQRTGPPRRKS